MTHDIVQDRQVAGESGRQTLLAAETAAPLQNL